MSATRIFVIDDHAIVRHGLKSLIDAEPDLTVVGEAGAMREGLDGIRALQPDIALLDVRLQDGSGTEIARTIRDEMPNVKVLMLSSYDDDDILIEAFAAGAAAFVLKQIAPDALLNGLREVAAGRSIVGPTTLKRMMARMHRDSRENRENREPAAHDDLTPQERRILEMIGDGMTNREIGDRLFLAEKTIKNKVTTILAKLGVQRRTQAAVMASRMRR